MSFNIPLLLTGARGSGKATAIKRKAGDAGVNVIEVRRVAMVVHRVVDVKDAKTLGSFHLGVGFTIGRLL